MTSKVQLARERCGYSATPVLPTCSNCASFGSEFVLPAWMVEANLGAAIAGKGPEYLHAQHAQEKNPRCVRNGFAVKKMANCSLFKERA